MTEGQIIEAEGNGSPEMVLDVPRIEHSGSFVWSYSLVVKAGLKSIRSRMRIRFARESFG